VPASTPRIAVVGAGPVGATLALALSRAAIAVVLVERCGTHSSRFRPVALSCSSRRILDTLGAWTPVSRRASPIARVHVSQRGCFGVTRLDAAEYGVEALGYVADTRALVSALSPLLAEAAGVCRLSSTAVVGIARRHHGVRIELAGAAAEAGTRSLEVDAAVAADGGSASWCAAEIECVESREYAQVALGALVRTERDHCAVAYERFTPEGPIALLPSHDGACVLVWTLPPERGRALLASPEAFFRTELHRAFGDRLGRFLEVRHREIFPLRKVRSRTAPASRIFLAGSAAHTLHPVAGQGLNLGLRDAAVLAEVMAETVRGGGDPGSPECFERYLALRRSDHRRVGNATDLLARIFLPESRPMRLLRGAALVGLDLATPLKREFARHAMGLGLPASRLVRGMAP